MRMNMKSKKILVYWKFDVGSMLLEKFGELVQGEKSCRE